ncbi:MAG: response regulator [Pseudobdellovibrionaceae bacterium]
MARGKIAILEDDMTLGAALKTAFERADFEAYFTSKPSEIQEYLERNNVMTLFVDCLLPTGSGVDFVEGLRKKFPPNSLDVVMMSGIFSDASVIKDTVRATKATAFLKKPFDLEEAIACVKTKDAPMQREDLSPRKALYLLFNKPKVSVREKRKAIEALEEIHGFDLPYLYSLLVETLASGHLNIVGQKGDVLGISFSNGRIVAVDIADKETQLGKLLIEAGYIYPDDLKEALSATTAKKLGDRLITANLLSPHAFNIALANQMSIRLSRTIIDMPVKVNFVATDVELTHPHIDSEAFSVFLHDWIASKIDFEWLKAHYTQWGDYSLAKSPAFSLDHPLLKMPLVAHFHGFVDFLTKGQSLNQMMDQKKFPEETAYKALHLLLAKGILIFADRAVSQDPAERIKVLKRLQSQLAHRNKLETWDVLVGFAGGSDSDVQFVFNEYKRLLGPQPPADQKEIAKIWEQLKQIGEEALKFAHGGSREKMKEEIAKQEVEAKIKASSLFEEARAALHKSLYTQAMPLLTKSLSLDPSLVKVKLHLIWARLGQAETRGGVKPQLLSEVEMDLLQVPPEEKYEALYSFVMGLFSKAKGDLPTAKKFFEKAYNLDNNFIAARREIAIIVGKTQKKDPLNRDLKELVAGFFNKKK